MDLVESSLSLIADDRMCLTLEQHVRRPSKDMAVLNYLIR
jgi:hypothetical protein